jgi:pimeloyl-ACP methyl ester carboxylesterase
VSPSTAVRWEKETLPCGAVRLRLWRVVAPPAPPILLVHGLGVTGAVWVPFALPLAPRYAALAPDLRGHGASDEPATGYAPADYARDLIGLHDAVRLGATPVVGHSLGALVALALADLRPDLVTALVLVDPPLDAAIPYTDVRQVYRLRHEPAGALEAYLLAADPSGNRTQATALAGMFRQAADAAFEATLATAPQSVGCVGASVAGDAADPASPGGSHHWGNAGERGCPLAGSAAPARVAPRAARRRARGPR